MLRESTLKATGAERFQWHLPAAEYFRSWPAELHEAMQREQGALQSLSELVRELVSQAPERSIDTTRLHEIYRVELARRAWVTAGGSLRMTAIAASFLEHVKSLRVMPELETLPATPEEAAIQLGRMLRPPRSGTHPLRHLVLINWLFGSAEAFKQCYLSDVRAIKTWSPGTTLKEDQSAKDVKDPRRDQLVVLLSGQNQSLRMAAKSLGVDVGTAMAWAAQAGLSVPRRPKKLTGHLRRQAITDLQSGADKAVVAANAGVSVITITKLLLSEVGLHAAWCHAKETKARASERQAWEELLRTHKGLGVKFIRALNPSAYIWLYRNDRAWLDDHKPDRPAETMALGGARVMWDARDEALSEVVRQWLSTVFPALIIKAEGKLLNQVDGVLFMQKSSSSVWPYILAASVLYKSADQALNGLFDASKEFAEAPKRQKFLKSKIDNKGLIAIYVECRGRYADVAKLLAIPLHQVKAMLSYAGLPNLVSTSTNSRCTFDAVDAFYRQGKSFHDSAAIGRLNSSEMDKLIRGSGPNLTVALKAMAARLGKRKTGVKRVKALMPKDISVAAHDRSPDHTQPHTASRANPFHKGRETEPHN